MSSSQQRVSVLIAAYNAEAYVHHAIASALAQTGVDLEVIVVDDGSHDGTAASVRRRAASDPRIRLVRLPTNQGPAQARNAGLAAATGDWVAVLDADDSYLPGRLAHLVELGCRCQADIVADAFLLFNAASGVTSPALAAEPSQELMDLKGLVKRSRPYGEEADFGLLKPMLRRAFVLQSGLRYAREARHGEDFLMVFEALRRGAKYVLSRKPFYLYTTQDLGGARTWFEFERQIAQTAELKSHADVALDKELLVLLDQRCSALRRQQSEGNFVTMRRQRHDAPGGINLPIDLADWYLMADDPTPFRLQ
jgi:glycosyltransferase involved in cell wall biosynthesis